MWPKKPLVEIKKRKRRRGGCGGGNSGRVNAHD
jgi:hypothetical protein